MARIASLHLATALIWLLIGAGMALAEGLTVFAAASLRNALDDVAVEFEAEHGGEVTIAYAGSSVLARQIQYGAPADIFLSANEAWMDMLGAADLIAPESRTDLLTNQLVLIAPAGEAAALSDLSDLPQRLSQGNLAMALVTAVPAGIYGKQALEKLGVWQALAPQVAQADNVRAALALVATGAAPLGLVYASDAMSEPRVTILAEIPATLHDPIIYPVAALQGADQPSATKFLSFLASARAQAIFAREGFGLAGD